MTKVKSIKNNNRDNRQHQCFTELRLSKIKLSEVTLGKSHATPTSSIEMTTF